MKKVTRREFIKKAGVGAAGLAVGSSVLDLNKVFAQTTGAKDSAGSCSGAILFRLMTSGMTSTRRNGARRIMWT